MVNYKEITLTEPVLVYQEVKYKQYIYMCINVFYFILAKVANSHFC